MTNYREILRLHSLGINNMQAAASLGCSRTTVIQVLNLAESKGLKYPLPEGMSDAQLAAILFPPTEGKPTYRMPDYANISNEMQKDGTTLNRLWLEYCEQCQGGQELPYQLTQFKKYYRDYVIRNNAVMHLDHKPGEILQVDWCGDTASVIDTDTGEPIPVYIFVATLPYSGYSYVEGFFSMDQACWTEAHVNAFRFFGGVTRIIQCDNLKTGVIRHGKDEPELNQAYQELAEHYGTAVIPARVRAPRDKAAVEGTVGIISRYILGALRNQQFLSLHELNEAIEERLYEFNHKPFQKRSGSRASEFETERLSLLPLPAAPFELASWKVATVGPNYHISVDHMNYSVPYEYIRQKVDVRLTRTTVEVFYGGSRICSHKRLYGKNNQYSTLEAHMPDSHKEYLQWNGDRFRRWADKVGPETRTVIDAVLNGYKVEQQGYKSCMGILRLADKYTPGRLENACRRALTYTPRPYLKQIQAILSSGQDKPEDETPASQDTSSQYGFTRGVGYYGRKK